MASLLIGVAAHVELDWLSCNQQFVHHAVMMQQVLSLWREQVDVAHSPMKLLHLWLMLDC